MTPFLELTLPCPYAKPFLCVLRPVTDYFLLVFESLEPSTVPGTYLEMHFK
jgi:hypothetical protein